MLQQIENRHAECEDTNSKLEFHRALVWNTVQEGNLRLQPPTAPQQLAVKDTGSKTTTASPGTKTYALFNQGKCAAQAKDPADKHICSYCLNMARKVCSHQERLG